MLHFSLISMHIQSSLIGFNGFDCIVYFTLLYYYHLNVCMSLCLWQPSGFFFTLLKPEMFVLVYMRIPIYRSESIHRWIKFQPFKCSEYYNTLTHINKRAHIFITV